MSNMSFTPGPWEFDVEIHWVNQPGEQEVHGAWDVYPVDDCDHIIATVNHVYPDRNTCRYNARLIAAAPDMYEALKAVQPFAKRFAEHCESNFGMVPADFANALLNADAALAKVQGKDRR
jgi:hypothetical protein